MPRKTYFMLDSGKFFEMDKEPLPMTTFENERYKAALKAWTGSDSEIDTKPKKRK